ncbi:MAG: rod shape-determining protein RodA [Candidatus Omnitrophica bacterium]|nr:rod shape-determining protein RodA [Candidatus Omnitrophota bacterium]
MIPSYIKQTFKDFYWILFFLVIIIASIGIVFIHSASMSSDFTAPLYALKQFIWLILGICFLFGVTAVGYRSFLNVSYLLYICSLLLLIAVLFIGTSKFGAQRWIPLGNFAFQPSEFAKLAVILALSHYLGSRKRNILQRERFFIAFILTFIPLVLIVNQPDLGTALIFLPILYCMLYLWGTRLKYIFMSFFLGALSMPIVWHMLKPYQKNRLLTFININADPLRAGYTAIQSKIAVGSGGFWGKGLFEGTQNRLNFVPEHHTDFIFCIISEEGGFLAAFLLLVLFFILIKLAIGIIQKTTDPEAKLLAIGITAMLLFQVCINIGMTIGLCPITGLPLPLISYGGSSMLTYFIAFGLLISIYKDRTIF